MDPIPPQYGEVMTDPYTGLVIPKTLAGNLLWRKGLIAAAKQSAATRRTLRAACSASPIYWLNAFGWTYLQKKINHDGTEIAVHSDASNIPFITWRVQDDAIRLLVDCIFGGKDGLVSKSRDMGASWLCVATFQWAFQFRSNVTFLELSRKESLVDRPGDMDSLFEKHRYLMRMQPDWLRPENLKDNRLHLENLKTGSTIIGESTNKDAGQASRKTAILLDEFARVEKGEEIDLSTADTTACRIFNSTPGGPNTHFTRVWRQIQRGTRTAALIELPWWRHPDKGKDAVLEDHPERPGQKRWTSPWYKAQCARRSKKNIAQNLDMDPGNSGDMFFDDGEITKHRNKYEREPRELGFVVYDEDMTEERIKSTVKSLNAADMLWVKNGGRRSWRLWMPLLEQTVKDKWSGGEKRIQRPRQDTRYVFGIDISTGAGASNSVITVLDHQTNMVVAKFWDSHTDPEKLAEVAATAGVWFGGLRPPLICFEKNGPGGRFGRKLLALGYPSIYNQKVDSVKGEPDTQRWGWQSSPARKELLLGQYRDALATERFINPCREALLEASDYVYDDKGKIEPGLKLSDEEGGGTALHGDHVIADALAEEGRKNLPKEVVAPLVAAPAGTFGWRREQRKRNRPEKMAWSD
jgi:hypothetical protein